MRRSELFVTEKLDSFKPFAFATTTAALLVYRSNGGSLDALTTFGARKSRDLRLRSYSKCVSLLGHRLYVLHRNSTIIPDLHSLQVITLLFGLW
jgi:hypothetical protein